METPHQPLRGAINVDIVDSTTTSTFEVDNCKERSQTKHLERSQTKINTTLLITFSVAISFLLLGQTVYIAATWQAARLGERYLYFTDASCTGDVCLLIPATEKEVNTTLTFFSAGEEVTDLYDPPLLIKDEARSTPHLQRYQAVYQDEANRRALGSLQRSLNGDAANDDNDGADGADGAAGESDESDDYHSGVTMILSPEDQSILYEDHLEILEGGYATLGEYADKNGQVGDRVLRTQVKIMSGIRKGDRFFLVPLGFSMTGYDDDNYTMARRPELFYFSYVPTGVAIEDRLVSICMEANFKADLNDGDALEATKESHCFLGHGDEYWGEVQKYANAWFTADMADGGGFVDTPLDVVYEDDITDDVGNDVVDGGTGEGTRRRNLKIGFRGWKKSGAVVGKKVGEKQGGSAGAAAGGACCGPVGAAIGRKVGAWVGGKIGKKAGSYIGGKLGGRRRRRRRKRL